MPMTEMHRWPRAGRPPGYPMKPRADKVERTMPKYWWLLFVVPYAIIIGIGILDLAGVV